MNIPRRWSNGLEDSKLGLGLLISSPGETLSFVTRFGFGIKTPACSHLRQREGNSIVVSWESPSLWPCWCEQGVPSDIIRETLSGWLGKKTSMHPLTRPWHWSGAGKILGRAYKVTWQTIEKNRFQKKTKHTSDLVLSTSMPPSLVSAVSSFTFGSGLKFINISV